TRPEAAPVQEMPQVRDHGHRPLAPAGPEAAVEGEDHVGAPLLGRADDRHLRGATERVQEREGVDGGAGGALEVEARGVAGNREHPRPMISACGASGCWACEWTA